ncbi:MAG: indole-3-glycerol-phosphate synthase [Methanoregulaceae archaeon]|nr:indole-3-glycerol-phosphate synthase [Methanoregulaceae archaeon]
MILDEIIGRTCGRVNRLPPFIAETSGTHPAIIEGSGPLSAAIRTSRNGCAVIAEMKQASPSTGIIARDCRIQDVSHELTAGGAVALSVLTEPYFFAGSPEHIGLARLGSNLPILRKDFIIDPRQLYETSVLGADAVLLIARLLGDRLPEFVDLACALGIEPLVEVHTMSELECAVRTRTGCIGINNRDLGTMQIDLGITERLSTVAREARKLVVSESGIRSVADIRRLMPHCDAFLIGSSVMAAKDRKRMLEELVCA